jgi:IclR family acetate operon transcriptional repressor
MPRPGPRYSLLTLEKGLLTLEMIADTAGDIGLSELSARLDEPISVVFRVLRTLLNLGYLSQDPVTKRYSLGLRVWELGEKAAARLDIRDSVQPALNKLTRATGETASFAWVRDHEYTYIATADGSQPLRAYVERGSRLPLSSPTASARAILAFSDAELVDAVLAGRLKRQTPTTVTDPQRVRAMLDVIRERGVAVVHAENQPSLSAVAAPIRDPYGRCIGAIALSGLTSRFEGDTLKRIVQLVKAEAKDLERRIRFQAPSVQLEETAGAPPPASRSAARRTGRTR